MTFLWSGSWRFHDQCHDVSMIRIMTFPWSWRFHDQGDDVSMIRMFPWSGRWRFHDHDVSMIRIMTFPWSGSWRFHDQGDDVSMTKDNDVLMIRAMMFVMIKMITLSRLGRWHFNEQEDDIFMIKVMMFPWTITWHLGTRHYLSDSTEHCFTFTSNSCLSSSLLPSSFITFSLLH